MGVHNYDGFIAALLESGFSMHSENSNGIYSVLQQDITQEASCEQTAQWHTGDPETDPWEWRMRVLDERNDIAYAKLFFKKSGYITKDWYPYFLKLRRDGASFAEKYAEGTASNYAKRIYDVLEANDSLPVHTLKELAGFSSEDKSKFDRAITELQTGMFITMCGRQQKRSKIGEEYGWSSTVFCTVERFFGTETFDMADKISEQAAMEKITEQVYKLNPTAEKKKILKFIMG